MNFNAENHVITRDLTQSEPKKKVFVPLLWLLLPLARPPGAYLLLFLNVMVRTAPPVPSSPLFDLHPIARLATEEFLFSKSAMMNSSSLWPEFCDKMDETMFDIPSEFTIDTLKKLHTRIHVARNHDVMAQKQALGARIDSAIETQMFPLLENQTLFEYLSDAKRYGRSEWNLRSSNQDSRYEKAKARVKELEEENDLLSCVQGDLEAVTSELQQKKSVLQMIWSVLLSLPENFASLNIAIIVQAIHTFTFTEIMKYVRFNAVEYALPFAVRVRHLALDCRLSFSVVPQVLAQTFNLFVGFLGKSPALFLPSRVTVSNWVCTLGQMDMDRFARAFRLSFVKPPHPDLAKHVVAACDDSGRLNKERQMTNVAEFDEAIDTPTYHHAGCLDLVSGSSDSQATSAFNLLHNKIGIPQQSFLGLLGDNANSQTGKHNGMYIVLGKLLGVPLFCVGCDEHVLSLVFVWFCTALVGKLGDMDTLHPLQLVYKVAYGISEKRSFWVSAWLFLFPGTKLLSPHIPGETRWLTYIHAIGDMLGANWTRAKATAARMYAETLSSESTWKKIWLQITAWMTDSNFVWLTAIHEFGCFVKHEQVWSELPDFELRHMTSFLARLMPIRTIQRLTWFNEMKSNVRASFPQTFAAARNAGFSPEKEGTVETQLRAALPRAEEELTTLGSSRWLAFPLLGCMLATREGPLLARCVLRVLFPDQANSFFPNPWPQQTQFQESVLAVLGSPPIPSVALESLAYAPWQLELHLLALVAGQKAAALLWFSRWFAQSVTLLAELVLFSREPLYEHLADKPRFAKAYPALRVFFQQVIYVVPHANHVIESYFSAFDQHTRENMGDVTLEYVMFFVLNTLRDPRAAHQERVKSGWYQRQGEKYADVTASCRPLTLEQQKRLEKFPSEPQLTEADVALKSVDLVNQCVPEYSREDRPAAFREVMWHKHQTKERQQREVEAARADKAKRVKQDNLEQKAGAELARQEKQQTEKDEKQHAKEAEQALWADKVRADNIVAFAVAEGRPFLEKCRVTPDLVLLCKLCGVTTTGKKGDVIDRLLEQFKTRVGTRVLGRSVVDRHVTSGGHQTRDYELASPRDIAEPVIGPNQMDSNHQS